MSASPAGGTPGRTPNGTLPPLIRRPRVVDPMVRPARRRPQGPPPAHAANGVKSSGSLGIPLAPGPGQLFKLGKKPASHDHASLSLAALAVGGGPESSGFSSPAIAEYVDYPLIMTKKDLMARHHVAKFYSRKPVDPFDQNQFVRPVRLHRRNPRDTLPGARGDGGMENGESKEDVAAEQDRQKQDLLRAQREAEREIEAAKEAPTDQSKKRFGPFQKKTEQRFNAEETEEQRENSQLRYEEAIPWVMEDFDGKQTWVANYEAALSKTYAQIAFQGDRFTMVPVEKWYKFAPKPIFKTLGIEEAEKRMTAKVTGPRWFMDKLNEDKVKERAEKERQREAPVKLYAGRIDAKDDGLAVGAGVSRQAADVDELDFEEDFADDEENPMFEGEEEDTKAAAAKIKRDHLQANVFDTKDEKQYETAEQMEEKQKTLLKRHGKKVKKALMKREKNYIYDSDSENWSSDSDSPDTEAEKQKQEKQKKETEEKKPGKDKSANPPSGASTRGNNTPNHRPSKHLDPLQRTASAASLKRPGSPNLSDASGNESARKKPKKKHMVASNLGTGVNTPSGPPSRPRSPANPTAPNRDASAKSPPAPAIQRRGSKTRPHAHHDGLKRERTAASGSEGEGTRSAAEMSDGSRKRIHLRVNGPEIKEKTPTGSRATSPDRASAAASIARPGSPPQPTVPTVAEVQAAIPDKGITISELLKVFKGRRIHGPEERQTFLRMMRQISSIDASTKVVTRKA